MFDTTKLKNRKYFSTWNGRKGCCKRVDSQDEQLLGIQHRFLRDQVYRESQLVIDWTEQKYIEMDELTKRNHTYHLFAEEFQRNQGQCYLPLNKSNKNALMRLRADFRAAVSLTHFLHHTKKMTLFLKRFMVGHVRPELVELKYFFSHFFCDSLFGLHSIAIHCIRRSVWLITLHTSIFSCTLHASDYVHTHFLTQVSAYARHSKFMPSMMSG